MPLLIAPILATPLLKIPLLVSHVVCTYYGMTPPTQRPDQSEKERAPSDGLYKNLPRLQMATTATAKYVLCGLALAEAGTLLAQQHPNPLFRAVDHISLSLSPACATGFLLTITGGLVRIWCHRTLGRLFTWEISVREDHKLATSGPYAVVRHPAYTGWLALIAGNVALLLGRGSYFVETGLVHSVAGRTAACAVIAWLTWVSIGLVRRMGTEDEAMRKEFGSRWEEWAKRTPYCLIPFIY